MLYFHDTKIFKLNQVLLVLYVIYLNVICSFGFYIENITCH